MDFYNSKRRAQIWCNVMDIGAKAMDIGAKKIDSRFVPVSKRARVLLHCVSISKSFQSAGGLLTAAFFLSFFNQFYNTFNSFTYF